MKILKWVKETYSVVHSETDVLFLQPGEFGEWIGYAPRLAHSVDPAKYIASNLAYKGSGELGRLTTALLECEIEESKGWQEFNLSFYDKKLWDDSG